MAVLPEPLGSDSLITTFAGVVQIAVSTVGFSEHTTRRSASTVDAIEQMGKAIGVLQRLSFSGERRSDLPDLPMLNVGCIMGGRGRSYDLRGPNYVSDYCTVLVDIRFPPGMTSTDVIQDVCRALDRLQAEDSDFVYEISREIPEQFAMANCNFEPTEVPTGEYIVQSVARHYETVSGQRATKVGSVVPWSYAAGDTSHLWRAGIPCLFYGPNSTLRVPGDTDDCVSISQMLTVSKVLTLTALDVCNLPS
jgi:acetylornithine deacetylase